MRASDTRTNQEVDDVDDAIPPSPLSRRVEGEASLLQGVPPVIAALVAEQELVDNGDHSASESPLGADDAHDDDSEPDDDDDPDDFDFAVGDAARELDSSHRSESRLEEMGCRVRNGE